MVVHHCDNVGQRGVVGSALCTFRARTARPSFVSCVVKRCAEIVQFFSLGSIPSSENGPELEGAVGGGLHGVSPREGLRPREMVYGYAPSKAEVRSVGMGIIGVSVGKGMGLSQEGRVGSGNLDPASSRGCEDSPGERGEILCGDGILGGKRNGVKIGRAHV